MKTYFYLNDKETTRKEVKAVVGDSKLKELIEFARDLYHKSRTASAEKYYVMVDNNMLGIEFVG